MCKYPDIQVTLTGADGNAFAILGKVMGALRRARISSEEIQVFQAEAMAGGYNALLRTCMRWVSVI